MDRPPNQDMNVDKNGKLTLDCLLTLFTYLALKDLISAQRVCRGWRIAAQHKWLWRNFKLTLTGTREDERNVTIMPAVRNIDGEARNEFINVILDNVIDLSKMNVVFTPPLSSEQVRRLLEKYPDIESIKLNVSAPDSVELINVLPTFENIISVNLYGKASNSLFNVILENVVELSELNVLFMPPLSSTQFTTLKDKYPGLQSIKLDLYAPDSVESVNILRTCQNLKYVYFAESLRCGYSSSSSKLLSLCTVIADEENYPALSNVHIPSVYNRSVCEEHCLPCIQDPSIVNHLISIIDKRYQQLTSLIVTIEDARIVSFITAVNTCTNLHTLDLFLSQTRDLPHVCLYIENMTQLRSLSLTMSLCIHLSRFYESLCKGSWLHLSDLYLDISKVFYQSRSNILKAVIENMKQLAKLHFVDKNNVSESELKDIGNLSRLKMLRVSYIGCISQEGMNYIAQCKNLTELLLYARKSSVHKWGKQTACMICEMKELASLKLVIDNRGEMFLGCRKKIVNFIASTLKSQ